ncbi:MAG: hypothetical protein ACKVP4_05260 [Hyphomicrobium sp.]
MSDDKKLPVPHASRAPSHRREEYVVSPVRQHSLLGRVWSRFVAGLNTKTIEANTAEGEALNRYVKVRGALADAMLDADRRIANYVDHRDDIIEDDHQAHVDRMKEAAHERELNHKRREATVRAVDAHASLSEMQQGYEQKIAVETNEAALAQAKFQADRARWGHEAFTETMPFRKERLAHLYKTGALDAEIERLLSLGERDNQQRQHAPADKSRDPDSAAAAAVKQLLDELTSEIELARRTHAGDEHISALYAFRARLSAKLAELKGQAGADDAKGADDATAP